MLLLDGSADRTTPGCLQLDGSASNWTSTIQVSNGYASSEHGRRQICPDCGTGLLYRNAEFLPGITDVQTATFDDPSLIPPGQHVQTAERIEWMKDTGSLPEFERFPKGA